MFWLRRNRHRWHGMKAAPVELATGELRDRLGIRIDTPNAVERRRRWPPSSTSLVDHHEWTDPIGAAMPTVVRHGVVHSAANIDESWIGVDVDTLFTDGNRCADVAVLNDADAAGVAEMTFGGVATAAAW